MKLITYLFVILPFKIRLKYSIKRAKKNLQNLDVDKFMDEIR